MSSRDTMRCKHTPRGTKIQPQAFTWWHAVKAPKNRHKALVLTICLIWANLPEKHLLGLFGEFLSIRQRKFMWKVNSEQNAQIGSFSVGPIENSVMVSFVNGYHFNEVAFRMNSLFDNENSGNAPSLEWRSFSWKPTFTVQVQLFENVGSSAIAFCSYGIILGFRFTVALARFCSLVALFTL